MHFKVYVIHRADQYVEDLLAPYDENIQVEPYFVTKMEELEAQAAASGMSVEDYAEHLMNYTHDEHGNCYSTYNPKGKWDWWQEYGRFGALEYIDDDGEPTISNIDFSGDPAVRKGCEEWWDRYIDTDKPTKYNPEYYKAKYKDKETYVAVEAAEWPYACITPDGEWHAPGEVGYFASSESDDEWIDWMIHFKERYLDPYDSDTTYITAIDCHI